MEDLIMIILVILLGIVVILFICYVVIPIIAVIGSVGALIISVIAIIYGCFSALKNYIIAIKRELNFIVWEWEKDDEPAQRSYFFGPGYVQLAATIKMAFRLNIVSGSQALDTADFIKGENDDNLFIYIVRTLGSWIYIIVAFICIYGVGTVLCALLSLVHGGITTIIMVVTYITFTVVWIIDRIYLLKNKIRSDCPVCHSRFLIPMFMCPRCGAMHRKLVPGPYGIWKHRCNCGKKLSSTFLNGRSKIEAVCPDCYSMLVASDARPVVFQLIGGSKAGKTVFLSAFFHQYMEKLYANPNLDVSISEQYRPFFEELGEWYSGDDCPSTTQLNSQMYPILIDSSLGVKRQFSIYDIAGEMFDGFTADSQIQQQQFHYCDGLLFLIDPFSSGKLRMDRIRSGEDLSDFSEMAVEDVVTNFINYLIRTGHAKANARCNIPIAVLIAKADVREVKRLIGPAKINSVYRNNQDRYASYDEARDKVCRKFLIDIGLSATVENLEAEFSNLHYFAVSAMGHRADGSEYEPWGVMEAVEWMLPLADKELADLINSWE